MKCKAATYVFIAFLFVCTDAIPQGSDNLYSPAPFSYEGGSNPCLGDFDGDNDLDILVRKYPFTTIYRNDVNTGGGFTDMHTGLPANSDGDFAWGDYDNDGDLDIVLSGYYYSDLNEFIVIIFRNDNGTFVDIQAGLQGSWMGDLAWGDYDNDGDLDLFIYGSHEYHDMGEPIGILYRNDGNGVFTHSGIDIEEARRGTVSLGDYNNDGYLDILTCGYNLSENLFVSVLRNNSGTSFTDIGAGIDKRKNGALAWGDYDNDGDLDIYFAGDLYGNEAETRIYRNQGNGTFINAEANLPLGMGSYSGRAEWGDCDNDGDLDIRPNFGTAIFRNDGNNFFTSIDIGTDIGNSCWGDLDNDGDLDLVTYNTIYINNSLTVNHPPAIPVNLQADVAGDQATLSWDRGSDDHTPPPGLTYNVRIGTSPGASDVLNPMVEESMGYHRAFPAMGNAQTNTFKIIKDLPVGTYYWSVQAVDQSYLSSPFSSEGSFEIHPMYLKVLDTDYWEVSWADFDNDDDLDILSNEDGAYLYRNDGNDNFLRSELKINLGYSGFKWFDYDSDGDLDIISADSVFSNDLTGSFTHTGISHSVPVYASEPGDFDADGDIDFLDGSMIFQNNGGFNFSILQPDFGIEGNLNALHWFDFDNDSDLDIVLLYGNYQDAHTRLYRNDEEEGFVDTKVEFEGIWYNPICSSADYNNDGFLDLFLGGQDTNEDNHSILYRNNGNGTFTEISANIRGFSYPRVFWGDYNDDGLIDLIISGRNNGRVRNHLYRNNNNGTFTEQDVDSIVEFISIYRAGDYDQDGDLDMLTSAGIFRNNLNQSYPDPGMISHLDHDLKGMDCLLTWDRSGDPFGKGYSYNIKIGRTPGGWDIKAPNLLPGFGNVPCDTTWLIRDLVPGIYYWSVQAVNQVYARGPWAPVQSFTITRVSPDFSFDTVCRGIPTTFSDLSVTSDVIAGWKWDFHDGTIATDQHPSHVFQVAGTHQVTLWAYAQSGDSASRTREVPVLESPDAGFDAPAVCDRENVLFNDKSMLYSLSGLSYLWDFGDGETSGSQSSVTHLYPVSGTYSASLQISASNGCSSVFGQEVTVAEYPDADISLAPGYDINFCSGDSTLLAVKEDENFVYQWQLNGVDILGETGPGLVVRGPSGQYGVQVENTLSDCRASDSQYITVRDAPAAPRIVSENYVEGACLGEDPITLEVETVEGGVDYQWKRNGVPIGGATGTSYTEFLTEADYVVEASRGGCATGSEVLTIVYGEMPPVPEIIVRGPVVWYLTCSDDQAIEYRWYRNGERIPGADSYLYVAGSEQGRFEVAISDGSVCFARSEPVWIPLGTGVESGIWENLKIYPNPTPGLFTIELDNPVMGALLIDIYTEQGSKIINIEFKKETSHFKTQIDLSSQPPGTYVIGLILDDYTTSSKLQVE